MKSTTLKSVIFLGLITISSHVPAFTANPIGQVAENIKGKRISVGVGPDYSGVGAKIFLPLNSDKFGFYASLGLSSNLTNIDSSFGAGFGFEYKISRNYFVGLHSAIASSNNYSASSFNFTYMLHCHDRLSVGFNYVFAGNENYPLFSLGYHW
jgi:hypothetical protein